MYGREANFLSSYQKNNPRLITCVSVRKALSVLRILAARKMDEARANIFTKMSTGRAGEIFALVSVCSCQNADKPMQKRPATYECSACSNGQQRWFDIMEGDRRLSVLQYLPHSFKPFSLKPRW